MADVNGAVAANTNGDVEDAAAAGTLDTTSKEDPLTNGSTGSTVVQQDEQPADTLQPAADAPATDTVQDVPATNPEQSEGVAPTIEQTAAATSEPDTRPAVLIIGGLGELSSRSMYAHVMY